MAGFTIGFGRESDRVTHEGKTGVAIEKIINIGVIFHTHDKESILEGVKKKGRTIARP